MDEEINLTLINIKLIITITLQDQLNLTLNKFTIVIPTLFNSPLLAI